MKDSKAAAVISSLRLRTLPLSLSGVMLGSAIAAAEAEISVMALICLLLTTVSLQILSNLSNELGDVIAGTDTAERKGPSYGLNSGALTPIEMRRLILAFTALSMLFGTLLIYFSFGTLFSNEALAFMLLGAAAIIGAVRYTLGKNPYGYRGWGDAAVFVFFGLVSVMGAYYLMSGGIESPLVLLTACAIGCFSVGVLNINNIRDMKTDAPNRVTVAIKLGEKRARIYQTALVCTGWILMLCYTALTFGSPWEFLYLITLPAYIVHLIGAWKRKDADLDKMLPLLVLATFALSLLASLAVIVGARS